MSEYQYYEFLAVDRPLDAQALAAVRALSTRARITATSFVNEYHRGDFRGDPDELVDRYYDAHLYLANWGTRRILLRLPRSLLGLEAVERYCVDNHVTVRTAGQYLVLDLTSEDESGDWDLEPQGFLSAIVGIRAELAAGDLRALYLAWLAGYGRWERDEDAFDRDVDGEREPPVPAGLGALTASQRALADFLRLDDDLLAIAAETSPPLDEPADDPDRLTAWVRELPGAEKDRLILRVAQDQAAAVRLELLRRFRDDTRPSVVAPPGRTVGDLLDGAAHGRAERQRRQAAMQAKEEARREAARVLAHEQRLAELARDEPAAWARVDALIETRKQTDYDTAVALLADLRIVTERNARSHEFTQRCADLRQRHARKPSLLDRLDLADL
ncbi:hypothetical protein [Frankia sp. AgB32]|uniref:hypothetical protein n=1 Tax=Frankia sp. AgB32 TaxID=631119 RepID=UPI00200D61A2|nr:hypothetical protein [Frankia sp. AgB32]MCK9894422.1 hypothetical protein [Frankia sp. AgB32]